MLPYKRQGMENEGNMKHIGSRTNMFTKMHCAVVAKLETMVHVSSYRASFSPDYIMEHVQMLKVLSVMYYGGYFLWIDLQSCCRQKITLKKYYYFSLEKCILLGQGPFCQIQCCSSHPPILSLIAFIVNQIWAAAITELKHFFFFNGPSNKD